MKTHQKNIQGFVMIGLNFDTNHGEAIHAACQFDYRSYEISVSTGCCKPSTNNYPVFREPILVTHLKTGCMTLVEGSVEDAINLVNSRLSKQVNNIIFNDCYHHYSDFGQYPNGIEIEESGDTIDMKEMLELLSTEQKYSIEHQAV